MIDRFFCFVANSLLVALFLKRSFAFKIAMLRVASTQQKKLRSILRKNNVTRFGAKHNFSAINSYENFFLNVPVSNYDDYSCYIDLIHKGYKNILVAEPVLKLVPSSGSSAPSKYIPYTKSLKSEFQEGIAPWMVDLFCKRKKLLMGKAYWSITPAAVEEDTNCAGVPIGFEQDSSYFGILEKIIIRFLLVVPEEVNQIKDVAAFRYVTLFFFIKEKNLRFISIWNPTFLSLLLKPLDKWAWHLISDLEKGTITPPADIECSVKRRLIKNIKRYPERAAELREIFRKRRYQGGDTIYEKIWPQLTVVSCWADGASADYVYEVKKFFPKVEVQPKGLLATEGCVSFPLFNECGTILSVKSHFFEFVEIDNGRDIKLAHQLKKGKLYSVIITTGGGLYRYKLGDIVKVVGFKKRCPLIRFVSKEDKISDLFGEKLNEYHVHSLLENIFERNSIFPSFSMLAPETTGNGAGHYYTLFFEGSKNVICQKLKNIEVEIEDALCNNYHYNYCRRLGQLSNVRLFLISSGGWETYMRVCNSLGQKISTIKPSVLSSRTGWSKKFRGSFLNL